MKLRKLCSVILFLSISYIAKSQTVGESTFYKQYPTDDREYIEYIPGNLPIIISAPHGGVKLSGSTVGGTYYPDDDSTLPDRTCGTNERDDNTDILIREIQKEIHELTGRYAHVIINNLHRSKLDPNREIGEAACGDSDSEDHWEAFHDFIDDASTTVTTEWGKGIFLDIHGQSHSIPRIEIGFNISADDINNADLNAQSIIDESTIKNLATINTSSSTHEQLIRGEHSLGELFQEAPGTFYAGQNYPGCGHNGTNGYRAVPSDTDTGNNSCDDTRPHLHPYFDGDYYNNRRHGSGSGAQDGSGGTEGGGGTIDGMMTEVNRRVRDLGTYEGNYYDNKPQTLVPFAMDYASVILDFMDIHYNDFAEFSYNDCSFSINGTNPIPVITGILGGKFTADPTITIDSLTGEIVINTSVPGTYNITYTVNDCEEYAKTKSITINNGTSIAYVDISAAGGDGKSWGGAYSTLVDALTAACFYDTIKVATGTYIPEETDRHYSYPWYSNLVIQGGYASAGGAYDPNLYEVIISGDIGIPSVDTDNLYHVINVEASISNLVLSSLTIADGYADGAGDESKGAGVLCKGEVTLDNVKVKDNNSITSESILSNTGVIQIKGATKLELNGQL